MVPQIFPGTLNEMMIMRHRLRSFRTPHAGINRVVVFCLAILSFGLGVLGITLLILKHSMFLSDSANPVSFVATGGETETQSTPQASPTPSPHPRLLFLGDLMYDRNIRTKAQQNGGSRWPLQPLEPLMQSYDVVVANLEGPITSNPSTSVGSQPGSSRNFIFTFPEDTAPALAQQANFIVCLGNNHILNQGEDGVASTKNALEATNIPYFGWTTLETDPSQRVHVQTIQGSTFAFVNFNQFVRDGHATALKDLAWAESQPEIDATILMPHWGNEYQPTANAIIRGWATEFIEAGADLIIGGHPHVVQDFAEIGGVPVYFSLGNTVFDQYFSPEVMKGLAVGATWNPAEKTWSFEEYPLRVQTNGQTTLEGTEGTTLSR